jgi:hypothetical protein
MEQKNVQEKEELRNLYKISGVLFSLWRKNVTLAIEEPTNQLARQDEVVNVVEEIYLTYLSQLPTVVDSRTSTTLISDITKNCNNRLVIRDVSDSEFKTQGNHKYLAMLFKILVHNIPETYKEIDCSLTQNKQSVETLQLIFDIDLKPNQLNLNDENRLKIACALLNKMGGFYNMSVSPEYVEKELSHIRVSWTISES